MNALTTTTGTAVALPADPMQLMHLAERLAMARLIPPHFQKSPADCWLVMSFCRSRNLDFMMVVGECSVVQGRLFFSGKLTAALLNTSGHLADKLNYEYEYAKGEGAGPIRNRPDEVVAVTVSGRFANETSPRVVRVDIAGVRTKNPVWNTQPEQQLAYAGARIWGRRHAPEVLMGLLFEGETIDVTPVEERPKTPFRAGRTYEEALKADLNRDPINKPKPVPFPMSNISTGTMHAEPQQDGQPIVRIHDQKLAERVEHMSNAARAAIAPYAIELKGADLAHWTDWSQQLVAYVRAAPDVDTLNDWVTENAEGLVAFSQASPGNHTRLMQVINDELAKRGEDAT